MKLYDCQGAPNPRRVRIFVAEKGIDIPIVQVSILEGANLEPEFLAVNPRGVLATLVLDDGTVIDETPAICSYLESEYPDPPLLGTTPLERAQVISWDRHIENDGMASIRDLFRNSTKRMAGRAVPGRSGDPQIPELVERGKRGAGIFYQQVETRLADSPFLAGEHFTLADITGLCAIDFATFAKAPIPDGHSHTKRWYESVSSRPSTKL